MESEVREATESKRGTGFARAPLLCALLGLSLLLTDASLATARAKPDVAVRFVTAANRGDYGTVCRLYSSRYLKVSQASCCSLYRWGALLYGPFDYRIIRRRTLRNGHQRIDLIRWDHSSFIELAHELAGWRIVAGGW
jgi:hypothetical protein